MSEAVGLSGRAVLRAHILRAVLTVMLLTLRRVPSGDFVEQTIMERHEHFQNKNAHHWGKIGSKTAPRGVAFSIIRIQKQVASVWSVDPHGVARKYHGEKARLSDQKLPAV